MESADSLFDQIFRAGLSLKNDWNVRQNDRLDAKTRYVYNCDSIQALEENASSLNLTPGERAYATHRWRNFKRHQAWQSLLLEQVSAIRLVDNSFDKKQDFVISVSKEFIPFDLKVTRYPKTAPANMSDRDLAGWFYRNQSQEGRFHRANRFFIVGLPEEALYDIDLARKTIESFAQDMSSFRHFIEHQDGLTSRAVVLRQMSDP